LTANLHLVPGLAPWIPWPRCNRMPKCFRMAERSHDPDLKIGWAKLTEAWLSLVAKKRGARGTAWFGVAAPYAPSDAAVPHVAKPPEWLVSHPDRRAESCRHLVDWFEELRLHHRTEGRVVKLCDDQFGATRCALIFLRCAWIATGERFDRRLDPNSGAT
jgi:hypothetical protein